MKTGGLSRKLWDYSSKKIINRTVYVISEIITFLKTEDFDTNNIETQKNKVTIYTTEKGVENLRDRPSVVIENMNRSRLGFDKIATKLSIVHYSSVVSNDEIINLPFNEVIELITELLTSKNKLNE